MGSGFVGATKNEGIPARGLIQDSAFKWVGQLCSQKELKLRPFINHTHENIGLGFLSGRETISWRLKNGNKTQNKFFNLLFYT
jgi:hypothetical protein